ncbi:hypothetical protein R1flu_013196 [Riccia fluitans]|uniref:Uncharacterized protein n=1 Tax=Riccia fluitans TaxID=41844 RepID=A0ABD1YDA4_9MARC
MISYVLQQRVAGLTPLQKVGRRERTSGHILIRDSLGQHLHPALNQQEAYGSGDLCNGSWVNIGTGSHRQQPKDKNGAVGGRSREAATDFKRLCSPPASCFE